MIPLRNIFSGIKKQSITASIPLVVMLLSFMAACRKEVKEVVPITFDPEKSYTMRSTDITTLISDSGLTRYRLKAKEWLIYEKAKEPYWFFPNGIYVEKFDTLFQTEASIKADTAYNYEKKGLWKLVGNVKIESLEGKRFETSELFWDRQERRVYSDRFIRITENEDKVITGIGFNSTDDMSSYQIFNSTAEIPVEESDTDTIPAIRADSVAKKPQHSPAVPSRKEATATTADRALKKEEKESFTNIGR